MRKLTEHFIWQKYLHVRTKAELEELVNELYLKTGISDKIEKEALSEEMLYREALTQAWQRFGYPEVLAAYHTRLICTDDESRDGISGRRSTELSVP